ncbi:MAG: hypothetical protein HYZ52_05265 [Candidatus Omnitrophica bacterium]|nr:hypothetical protein [Candidatus Omnitrophota bacterium]
MPDATKLPYLIKLLDDESAVVQKAVLGELAAFGHSLDGELAKLDIDEHQRKIIQDLLAGKKDAH